MIMKKYKILVLLSILYLALNSGCNSFLEVESLTRMPSERLLADEKGLRTLLATLYNGIPMEDFNYRPNVGFNRRGWGGGAGEVVMTCMFTDEAITSAGNGLGPGSYNYWAGNYRNGFQTNRDINLFLRSIENVKNSGVITESQFNRLKSEAHFLRAYVYFGLVKRYGGVPIIDWLQDDDYDGDPTPLFIPRNTELETWKFILSECDKAIEHLPTSDKFAPEDNPMYRATIWAAYALKSRVALYAASLAKYGNRASFSGDAANSKLVGLDAADAAFFYSECIVASKALINDGPYRLYRSDPANPAEAATNYQQLFMNPVLAKEEIILGRTYQPGTIFGSDHGHDYDVRYSPSQAATGFHKWGRYSPSLNIVDLYEDYTADGTGRSAAIVTRTDGEENQYLNTNSPAAAQVTAIPFVKYDVPYEPFKNKDARLLASIVVPGANYKGVTIVMQGGLITKEGNLMLYQDDDAVGFDGETYYTYGALSLTGYSGFATLNAGDDANFSCSGFTIRKYLAEDKTVAGLERSSSTPWIDFRLAEIYLNFAEAVVESGAGGADQTAAAACINALRRRAGHTDNIPLTLDNVLKERRVELAFEGHRMWDLIRRREYHTMMQNFRRYALVQLRDLRENPPKYVFLRKENYQDIRAGGRTFDQNNYYNDIPGTNVSGLINNPGR
jgi:hypothetical protein